MVDNWDNISARSGTSMHLLKKDEVYWLHQKQTKMAPPVRSQQDW